MAQMTFAYKVRDTEGKLLEGTLDADNQGLVANRLRQMGYTPIKIEAKNAQRHEEGDPAPGYRRPRPTEGHGPLQPAVRHADQRRPDPHPVLDNPDDQTENPALAKVVTDVRGQVERGVSLSAGHGTHPKVFDRLFVSMVRAGEASGGLDQSLLQLAEHVGNTSCPAWQDQVGDGLPGGRADLGRA